MALDPERATFLMAEYRVSVSDDAPTKADYPNWRTLRLNTNIATTAGGDALAAELLATFKAPERRFEVPCDGVSAVKLSDFDGSPPTYAPDFPRFQTTGGTRLPEQVVIDHESKVTTLLVRG